MGGHRLRRLLLLSHPSITIHRDYEIPTDGGSERVTRGETRVLGKKWTHKKAERMEWEVQMRPVYPALKVGGVVLSVVSAPSLPFFSLPFHPGTIHI